MMPASALAKEALARHYSTIASHRDLCHAMARRIRLRWEIGTAALGLFFARRIIDQSGAGACFCPRPSLDKKEKISR